MRILTLLVMAMLAIALACGNGAGDADEDTGTGAKGSIAEADVGNGDTKDTNGSPQAIRGSAKEDKAALVAVLEALGSRPNWADHGASLNDVPPEQRIGVMTDEAGRVIGLLLSNNLLSGEIPAEVDDLPALRWLDLSANQISGQLPAELGNLTNLEGLVMGHNLLSGPLPPELGRLSALRVLSLGGNLLSGAIPPELGSLRALKAMDLGHNQLSGEIPPELGNLDNLRQWNLGGNMFSGDMPPEVRALAEKNNLQVGNGYLLIDNTVPYSAVADLENDAVRLQELLAEAAVCRGGLRFPEDSFCQAGGRYILGHTADGLMVARDLRWDPAGGPEPIGDIFKLLDEGVIPGFVSMHGMSISFGSPEGVLIFERIAQGQNERIVVISYTADRDLLAAVYDGDADRIRELVGKGANINARDSHGATSLGRAVSDGDMELVILLIEMSADVNLDTPLISAIDNGDAEMVRALVEAGADVNANDPWEDPWSHSVLDTAMFYGNGEIIQILTDAGAVSKWGNDVWYPDSDAEPFYPPDASGLFDAASNDDIEGVRSLIDAGVDVNAKAAGGESILTSAVYRAGPEVVQMLVDAGADANARDNFGRPVLFEAISPYDWGPDGRHILEILVNAGAGVNATDANGRSVLAEAIRNGEPEIVRILVGAGADVNAKDSSGYSPLSEAKLQRNPEIAKILLEAGAKE